MLIVACVPVPVKPKFLVPGITAAASKSAPPTVCSRFTVSMLESNKPAAKLVPKTVAFKVSVSDVEPSKTVKPIAVVAVFVGNIPMFTLMVSLPAVR